MEATFIEGLWPFRLLQIPSSTRYSRSNVSSTIAVTAMQCSCDTLVSRDVFDRKQQNRSKCCPEIARDAATIGSVQIHTQTTRHTHDRIDRRKAVKERSPGQGRCKNFTALHLATMSRGEQEDEGPTTKGSYERATKSLTSQSHLISQILLLLFRLNQILPYTAVLAQTGSLVHV